MEYVTDDCQQRQQGAAMDETEFPDWCSAQGAAWLAGKIRAYWLSRGHWVEVQVQENTEKVHKSHACGIWVVRSNLVRGMPR
jgi:hypothetical protein